MDPAFAAIGGGDRRRERAAREIAARRCHAGPVAAVGDSKLASVILFLFGWGIISATTVQMIASAAVSDGMSHPQLVMLSKIGKAGTFSGNCRRDLSHRWFKTTRVPALTAIAVPMLDSDEDIWPSLQLFMPPGRIIAFFWNKCRALWDSVMGANPRAVLGPSA